ncbi:uncharacterized protein LOC143879727 isoform X2 [Tasmannia lanceolata]
MDEYAGKRASGGFGISRRGSGLSFRNPNNEDRSTQYCNRIGCSARLNSMKSTQVINPEKAKYSRPSFHSSSSQSIVGSSSRTPSGANYHKKSCQEQQSAASLKETVLAQTSNNQDEAEVSEPIPTTTGSRTGRHSEPKDAKSTARHSFSANSTEEMGSCSVTSYSMSRKQVQQSGLGNQGTSLGSSVRRSFSSRNTRQTAKAVSQVQGANANRCGLGNLGCTSISDVLPSGSSSSESGRNRRAFVIKTRCPPEGESSSARGAKSTSGSSTEGNLGSPRNSLSSPSPSFPERSVSQQVSRRPRNCSTSSGSVASVRTRRTVGVDARTRPAEQINDNSLPLPEPIMVAQLPQTEFSIGESAPSSSSRSFPSEFSSIRHSSYGRPGSSNETVHSRPIAHPEDSNTRPFRSLSVDRDGFRRFNMEGIAEVLLALERIEQDEELTYEQLLVLESNLFLGGLSFHDQHRDMRLDIDNMSYEELLALEEKMGSVGTALTEEALSNCLKRSCYAPAPLVPGISCCGDEDTKCSICQEEYVVGDEVGKLGCDHRYHELCICQWLQQKNWCPICKAPASPS